MFRLRFVRDRYCWQYSLNKQGRFVFRSELKSLIVNSQIRKTFSLCFFITNKWYIPRVFRRFGNTGNLVSYRSKSEIDKCLIIFNHFRNTSRRKSNFMCVKKIRTTNSVSSMAAVGTQITKTVITTEMILIFYVTFVIKKTIFVFVFLDYSSNSMFKCWMLKLHFSRKKFLIRNTVIYNLNVYRRLIIFVLKVFNREK